MAAESKGWFREVVSQQGMSETWVEHDRQLSVVQHFATMMIKFPGRKPFSSRYVMLIPIDRRDSGNSRPRYPFAKFTVSQDW